MSCNSDELIGQKTSLSVLAAQELCKARHGRRKAYTLKLLERANEVGVLNCQEVVDEILLLPSDWVKDSVLAQVVRSAHLVKVTLDAMEGSEVILIRSLK